MPILVQLKDPDATALRSAVVATGLTQAEICRRARWSTARLSQFLKGKSRMIELGPAARLEDALDVDAGTLFRIDDEYDERLIVAYLPAVSEGRDAA